MSKWLDPAAPMLARSLQKAGYATGHFGKWHMGGLRDVNDAPPITDYGFDTSLTNFEGMGPKLLPLTLKIQKHLVEYGITLKFLATATSGCNALKLPKVLLMRLFPLSTRQLTPKSRSTSTFGLMMFIHHFGHRSRWRT